MKTYIFLALVLVSSACTDDELASNVGDASDAMLVADTESPSDIASSPDTIATPPEDTATVPPVDTQVEDTEIALEDATEIDEDTSTEPEDAVEVPEDSMAMPDIQPGNDTIEPPSDASAAGPGLVTLAFRHMDGGWAAPLTYNTVATSTSGEPFTYDFVRYWVTNVSFKHTDGSVYAVPASYYLVEETPQNTRLDVELDNIPAGTYESVTFSVGVDKEHNKSLDMMEGELSANVGMSWNWNTGYIFFKIEGTFGAEQKKFKMHVGIDENYRVVTREFKEPVLIDAANPATLWLRADMTRLFDDLPPGPYFFSISPLAKIVADNYGSFFDSVEVTAP